jgi:hypothetical protein
MKQNVLIFWNCPRWMSQTVLERLTVAGGDKNAVSFNGLMRIV